MNSGQFAYWLQGFFEITNATFITEKQTQVIRDHLDLVFNKVTPDRSKESSDKTLEDLLHTPLCGPIKRYFYNKEEEPLLSHTIYRGSC